MPILYFITILLISSLSYADLEKTEHSNSNIQLSTFIRSKLGSDVHSLDEGIVSEIKPWGDYGFEITIDHGTYRARYQELVQCANFQWLIGDYVFKGALIGQLHTCQRDKYRQVDADIPIQLLAPIDAEEEEYELSAQLN